MARRSLTFRLVRGLIAAIAAAYLLIVCALAGRIDLFLWYVITLGNIWLVICIVRQRGLELLLSAETGVGRSPSEIQNR